MIKHREVLAVGESQLAFTVFRKSSIPANVLQKSPAKRLLLLHGAGVAGELTWTFIVNYLMHWDEILVPDLLGMGESYLDPADQKEISIQDMCISLISLLHHQKWTEFDLVGYSLGGLVAIELNKEVRPDFTVQKMGLIEPALFNAPALHSIVDFRQLFIPIAKNIKSDPENDKHFIDFLDLVSPNRSNSPQVDVVAVQRLKERPLGFAHALGAVSKYADSLDELRFNALVDAIPSGVGIVGGLSDELLVMAQKKIQQHQSGWAIEILPKTDHSLIYVRPKRIAQLLNQHLL